MFTVNATLEQFVSYLIDRQSLSLNGIEVEGVRDQDKVQASDGDISLERWVDSNECDNAYDIGVADAVVVLTFKLLESWTKKEGMIVQLFAFVNKIIFLWCRTFLSRSGRPISRKISIPSMRSRSVIPFKVQSCILSSLSIQFHCILSAKKRRLSVENHTLIWLKRIKQKVRPFLWRELSQREWQQPKAIIK